MLQTHRHLSHTRPGLHLGGSPATHQRRGGDGAGAGDRAVTNAVRSLAPTREHGQVPVE